MVMQDMMINDPTMYPWAHASRIRPSGSVGLVTSRFAKKVPEELSGAMMTGARRQIVHEYVGSLRAQVQRLEEGLHGRIHDIKSDKTSRGRQDEELLLHDIGTKKGGKGRGKKMWSWRRKDRTSRSGSRSGEGSVMRNRSSWRRYWRNLLPRGANSRSWPGRGVAQTWGDLDGGDGKRGWRPGLAATAPMIVWGGRWICEICCGTCAASLGVRVGDETVARGHTAAQSAHPDDTVTA